MYLYQSKNILIHSPLFTPTKDPSTIISGDTIGMIVGVSISVLILVALIVFFAYFCPWLKCYQTCCWRCALLNCCDCIYCFNKFPFLEKRAYNKYIIDSIKSNRIYEQNFITTSDGRIVEAGEIRKATGSTIHAIKQSEYQEENAA